jgi:hypothetical protein
MRLIAEGGVIGSQLGDVHPARRDVSLHPDTADREEQTK